MSMVGKNIDDFCTRCGLTLAHVVLYEVKEAVRGVKCATCGSEHRYRGAKPEKQRHTTATRGAARVAPGTPRPVRSTDARLWERRNTAAAPDAIARDYRVTERYEKADMIVHPQFGRGFVETISADSMEVLFREGRKALVMNRRAAPEKAGG